MFRALALGDLLCAVPALRAMRRAWPSAEISLIGLPWAREFAHQFSRYVDRFWEFPGYPGLPERAPQFEQIPAFFAALQRYGFDLALQLHGSGRYVNEIVALIGARRCAGFYLPGDYCPTEEGFLPWPTLGLETHRLLQLVEALGVPAYSDELEFPLSETDHAALAAVMPGAIELRHYAVVHPGASTPERRWPREHFAKVADELAAAGLTVVLSGVASERPLAAQIAASVQQPVADLVGRTSLGSLGALVSQAALVVANDTAISHVAAALQTPSVIVSTGDNPARWGPVNRRLHRVLCSPAGVSAAEVCRAARDLLSDCRHRPGRSLPPQLVTS